MLEASVCAAKEITEVNMDEQVSAFLKRYVAANMSADGSAVADLYAEIFLFGGPKGTQTVKKEDLAKAIPGMKAHFAAMGLSETHLESASATVLDSRYVLVKAGWTMSIQNSARAITRVDTFATYLLERKSDTFFIVLQIDHQDLATVIRSSVAEEAAQHD